VVGRLVETACRVAEGSRIRKALGVGILAMGSFVYITQVVLHFWCIVLGVLLLAMGGGELSVVQCCDACATRGASSAPCQAVCNSMLLVLLRSMGSVRSLHQYGLCEVAAAAVLATSQHLAVSTWLGCRGSRDRQPPAYWMIGHVQQAVTSSSFLTVWLDDHSTL
jgi:hypothetical protein